MYERVGKPCRPGNGLISILKVFRRCPSSSRVILRKWCRYKYTVIQSILFIPQAFFFTSYPILVIMKWNIQTGSVLVTSYSVLVNITCFTDYWKRIVCAAALNVSATDFTSHDLCRFSADVPAAGSLHAWHVSLVVDRDDSAISVSATALSWRRASISVQTDGW